MIPAESLYRLLHNLARNITAPDEVTEPSTTYQRENILDFAGLHELDLEDTATLCRVASGEGHRQPPQLVTDGQDLRGEDLCAGHTELWKGELHVVLDDGGAGLNPGRRVVVRSI